MNLRPLHISNPLEIEIANALNEKGIRFIHESQAVEQRIDFYLPEFNIYIEVKEYYSERSDKQLKANDEIILIQGKKAMFAFLALIPDPL